MDKKNVVQAYFLGLANDDCEQVVRLFAPDAIVHSPLYGKVEASRFYQELFADTQSSEIKLKNIFTCAENPQCAAAHFVYSWTMKGGSLVKFECVDVFEFAAGSDKILSLTIIYDTYQTRKSFEQVHHQ